MAVGSENSGSARYFLFKTAINTRWLEHLNRVVSCLYTDARFGWGAIAPADLRSNLAATELALLHVTLGLQSHCTVLGLHADPYAKISLLLYRIRSGILE